MDKIIPNNASRISLNDRFTMLHGNQHQNNLKKSNLNNQKGRNQSNNNNSFGRVGQGSVKNRKLVEDLERKLKIKLAMQLKQRLFRGNGQQRGQQPLRRLNQKPRVIRSRSRSRKNSVGNLTLVEQPIYICHALIFYSKFV